MDLAPEVLDRDLVAQEDGAQQLAQVLRGTVERISLSGHRLQSFRHRKHPWQVELALGQVS